MGYLLFPVKSLLKSRGAIVSVVLQMMMIVTPGMYVHTARSPSIFKILSRSLSDFEFRSRSDSWNSAVDTCCCGCSLPSLVLPSTNNLCKISLVSHTFGSILYTRLHFIPGYSDINFMHHTTALSSRLLQR